MSAFSETIVRGPEFTIIYMRIDSIILLLVLITNLCSCSKGRGSDAEESNRVVHLSIDDVSVLSDLIRHQQDYDSLFQHPFMDFLYDLHREYGLRITLYTYDRFKVDGTYRDGYTRIEEMPLKYKNDFKKASDWLRIGFHSRRADFDSLVSVADFQNSYKNVNSAIAQFADSSMVATTLRFHYFFAPDSLLNSLPGIRCLLCADNSNLVSYNLTADEARSVSNGKRIIKNDVFYRRTDLRVDDNFRIISNLERLDNIDTLVIFTHEWKLWHVPEADSNLSVAGKVKVRASECVNQVLFKQTVKWLTDAGYTFSFLE